MRWAWVGEAGRGYFSEQPNAIVIDLHEGHWHFMYSKPARLLAGRDGLAPRVRKVRPFCALGESTAVGGAARL